MLSSACLHVSLFIHSYIYLFTYLFIHILKSLSQLHNSHYSIVNEFKLFCSSNWPSSYSIPNKVHMKHKNRTMCFKGVEYMTYTVKVSPLAKSYIVFIGRLWYQCWRPILSLQTVNFKNETRQVFVFCYLPWFGFCSVSVFPYIRSLCSAPMSGFLLGRTTAA